jgi:hypothetical protein
VAAAVGSQLAGCSDDTTSTAAADAGAEASQQRDTGGPDALGPADTGPDVSAPDAGNDVATGGEDAETGGQADTETGATDANGDTQADAAADAGLDVATDAMDAQGDVGIDAQGDLVLDGGADATSDANGGDGAVTLSDAGGDAGAQLDGAAADAGSTMSELCAQALANNAANYFPVNAQCSGTELALFMRDVVKLGVAAATAPVTAAAGVTTATCLGCAFTNDCLDTTSGGGGMECEDAEFDSTGTGECVAMVQCAVTVGAACTGASVPADCTGTVSTYGTDGVDGLLCGSIPVVTCESSSEPVATILSSGGLCAAPWVAGVSPTDADGLTIYNDGVSNENLPTGYANTTTLECVENYCPAICLQ